MEAAVGLVVIDTQYAIAVRELAFPAFSGCFQCFIGHGTPFTRKFPNRCLADKSFGIIADRIFMLPVYHSFAQTCHVLYGVDIFLAFISL